jgi:hypothetical protein
MPTVAAPAAVPVPGAPSVPAMTVYGAEAGGLHG